jgi:hypothetical protein
LHSQVLAEMERVLISRAVSERAAYLLAGRLWHADGARRYGQRGRLGVSLSSAPCPGRNQVRSAPPASAGRGEASASLPCRGAPRLWAAGNCGRSALRESAAWGARGEETRPRCAQPSPLVSCVQATSAHAQRSPIGTLFAASVLLPDTQLAALCGQIGRAGAGWERRPAVSEH